MCVCVRARRDDRWHVRKKNLAAKEEPCDQKRCTVKVKAVVKEEEEEMVEEEEVAMEEKQSRRKSSPLRGKTSICSGYGEGEKNESHAND